MIFLVLLTLLENYSFTWGILIRPDTSLVGEKICSLVTSRICFPGVGDIFLFIYFLLVEGDSTVLR